MRSPSRVVLLATRVATSLLIAGASPSLADGIASPEPGRGPKEPSAPTSAEPSPARQGYAVLATGALRDAAWPVAQAVYASSLRPRGLDEAHARVLVGDAPGQDPDAGAPLRDLSEMRAALKGDDAPSRSLLSSIASDLRVQGIVVIMLVEDRPVARLFLADPGAFDAARYFPDPSAPPGSPSAWNPLVESLERARRPAEPPPTPKLAPLAAFPSERANSASSRPFYASPWFWGAIGAAAFAGGAVYLATRDNTAGPIQLQVKVPK